MIKLVTLALAIAVLGVPATTFADDTDQVAKQSFERGRQLAGEAKWAQAFDAFSSGYDASHRSVFLFNMAECARALDDAPRARGLYQQYLAASPTGDLADTARARIAAMPAAPTTTPTTVTPPPPSPTVSTTRPTTTTTPPAPPTAATRPIVIPPLPPAAPTAPPHATTLGPPPATSPTPPATPAIRATTPAPTTAAAVPAPPPTLTVAQLPPTSPAERPIVIGDSHPSEPIYRRTSFWVGVGLAVAAGTVAIIAASTHDNSCSTPGCIDLRR